MAHGIGEGQLCLASVPHHPPSTPLGAIPYSRDTVYIIRSGEARLLCSLEARTPEQAKEGALTLTLALTPCRRGTRGDVLLVAFSAQGPGIQQWQAAALAPLRALGASLDALYLADPSNSYYLQDPGGGWGGIAHFSELVRRESTPRYTHTPSTAHWYRALYVCTTLVRRHGTC